MAQGTKVKLFKIASEINIGKDAIVEFLQSKGYDIHNKPTENLDGEMIDLVMDKFKKEKKAAEVQREKLQKHRDIKQEIKKITGEIKGDDSLDEYEDETHNQVVSKADKESSTEDKKIQIEKNESLPEADNRELADNEIQHNIDVTEAENKSKSDAEPVVQEKIVVDTKPEKADNKDTDTGKSLITDDEKLTDKKEQIHSRSELSNKEQTKLHPAEDWADKKETVKADTKTKDQEEGSEGIEGKQSDISESKSEINVEAGDVDESAVESKVNSTHDEQSLHTEHEHRDEKEHKRKKKRRNIIEVQPGETPQLRGLTVLGKIDIAREEDRPAAKKDKIKSQHKPHKALIDDEDDDSVKSKHPKKKHAKPRENVPTLAREDKDIPDKHGKPGLKDKEKHEDKRKKKRKKSIRESISQEDVDRAIRETLSGMDASSVASQRAKMRMKKRVEREEKEQRIQEERKREEMRLKLTEFVTTQDLAGLMGIPSAEVILKCMQLGLMVTINQRLDKETITLIADDYGYEVEFMDEQEAQIIEDFEDEPEDLKPRAPIVTIMGHVDHGKTSLLDFIRHANVVAGEAGGITQHIGAYSVELESGKSITFLDTPGHEAFTAMRARGAQLTDIVVLVVAADDSVMPQTIEAISHAKAASVPIIVAINKIDKPDANPDRIRQQLADHGVLVEEWGGKFQSVEISAKKGLHIDSLMEKILLEAEFLELKANPDRTARGTIVESNMSKGMGSVATLIVQKGTLKIGDPFVSGVFAGKVRAMLDERGHKIETAYPSDPVMVIGFDGLPEAGDSFIVTQNDAEARDIANERQQIKRQQELAQIRHITLDELSAQIQKGGVKDLNVIIKGDVAGSVEALSDSLHKLSTDEVKVNILHKGAGSITENDVMLGAASNAIIIGFNVNPIAKARKLAETESVEIRHYNIIYDCINDIQMALEGLLSPEYKEETIATVEIRRVFKISRLGAIAGCYILSGKVTRNDKVRLFRDGFKIFEGGISSLKRGKDDVREVDAGYECGIQLDGYNDIQEGDIIESYKLIEVKRKLS